MAKITEPIDRILSACKTCGAPIYWYKTAMNKNIPVEPASINEKNKHSVQFNPRTMLSHFAKCYDADAWRGRSK